MKAHLTIAAVVLAVLIGLVLTLGRYLGFPTWLLAVLLGTALLIAGVIAIVGLIGARRRSGALASGMAGGGDASETAAMREQFRQYLDALRHSPSGKGALATLPWFLVIGAPGSGKTTLLQESGLAFASLGHGLRSIRGIGGTRNCDWWFTDRAIFLDTAGRYTTEPRDQPEWFSFLDLLRRHRGGRPLNGVIVTVPIPDLMRDHEAAIPAMARPIRERIAEVSHRLGMVLPVYIVFTKADMVGGFKDFFAGLPMAERDQLWGATLAAGEAVGDPGAAVDRHMQRLVAALQARRLSALSGDKPATALAKAASFPANVAQAQRWFTGMVAELMRPYPMADQPILRGFYFTSSVQPAKDTTVVNAAPPKPLTGITPPAPAPAPIQGFDQSIFIAPAAARAAPAAESAARRGFFLRDLFTLVIGDATLAGRPRAVRARMLAGRVLLTYGSLLIGAAACTWFAVGALRDSGLVADTAEACRRLRDAAGTDERVLKELDLLRQRLAAVRDHASVTGRSSITEVAHQPYFRELGRLMLQPAADRLRSDLALAFAKVDDPASLIRLQEVLSAYQMLTGAVPADRRILLRALIDEPRALVRFSAGATAAADERLRRQAADHVDYIASVDHLRRLAAAKQPLIRGDEALITRGRNLMSDNLWIPAYADMMATLQLGGGTLGRDALVQGDNRELLTVDAPLPAVFARTAYDASVRTAIEQRAGDLAKQMEQTKATRPLSRSDLERRLRSMYARDHLTRWLEALASLRPEPSRTLAEGIDRLRLLTGERSPYRTIGRQLSEQQLILSDVDSVPSLPSDPAWLEKGLDVAKDLPAALERLATTSQAGSRSTDLAKLREFAAALDGIASRLTEVAAALPEADVRRAVAACLRNLVEAAHGCVASELTTEVERSWAAAVERPFRESCAGRFPFSAETPSASAADAPLGVVARLFNPRSGAFWRETAQVEALRAIKITGRDLLPVTVDYTRSVATATLLRDALFGDGGEEMRVAIRVVFGRTPNVTDAAFQFGDSKVNLNDRPDQSGTLAWKQGQSGGAKISVQTGGRWLTLAEDAPGWGILRLMRRGNPSKQPDGHRMQWDLDAGGGITVQARLTLMMPALESLIVSDVLRTFAIPVRIGRDPREAR